MTLCLHSSVVRLAAILAFTSLAGATIGTANGGDQCDRCPSESCPVGPAAPQLADEYQPTTATLGPVVESPFAAADSLEMESIKAAILEARQRLGDEGVATNFEAFAPYTEAPGGSTAATDQEVVLATIESLARQASSCPPAHAPAFTPVELSDPSFTGSRLTALRQAAQQMDRLAQALLDADLRREAAELRSLAESVRGEMQCGHTAPTPATAVQRERSVLVR